MTDAAKPSNSMWILRFRLAAQNAMYEEAADGLSIAITPLSRPVVEVRLDGDRFLWTDLHEVEHEIMGEDLLNGTPAAVAAMRYWTALDR